MADITEIQAGAAAFAALVAESPLSADRRAHPADDLFSFIANDPTLELADVVITAILIAVAGPEITANLLGRALLDYSTTTRRQTPWRNRSDGGLLPDFVGATFGSPALLATQLGTWASAGGSDDQGVGVGVYMVRLQPGEVAAQLGDDGVLRDEFGTQRAEFSLTIRRMLGLESEVLAKTLNVVHCALVVRVFGQRVMLADRGSECLHGGVQFGAQFAVDVSLDKCAHEPSTLVVRAQKQSF